MLEQLISSGGDTDTIASIAGQIAGTVLGYEALPMPLVERLPERELVNSIAVKFSHIVCNSLDSNHSAWQALVHVSGTIQDDGIHPTAKGSAIIADTLLPVLKPLLHKGP